jgi:hypothetical protein
VALQHTVFFALFGVEVGVRKQPQIGTGEEFRQIEYYRNLEADACLPLIINVEDRVLDLADRSSCQGRLMGRLS